MRQVSENIAMSYSMKLQKSLETCFSDVHTMKLLSANNYVLRIFTKHFFPIADDIVYKFV